MGEEWYHVDGPWLLEMESSARQCRKSVIWDDGKSCEISVESAENSYRAFLQLPKIKELLSVRVAPYV